MEASQTPGRATWTPLTQLYFGLLAVRLLAYVFQYGAPDDVVAQPAFQTAHLYVHVVGIGAGVVVGLVWLHRAWTRVPPEHRITSSGRRVEPRQAALRLLIPVYDLYWQFVATWGLTDAIDHQIAAEPRRRLASAPQTLALVCCIVQLIPVANLLVSPLFWGAFMLRVDAVQADLDRRAK